MEESAKTVREVLEDLDDIAVIDICEDNVGHAYFDGIDEEFLDRHVLCYLVVKRSYGFEVHVEL